MPESRREPQQTSRVNGSPVELSDWSPQARIAGHGQLQVNLNWSAAAKADLDLGCTVRTRDGRGDAIQPLGANFGSFDHWPYLELDHDDRNGQASDGETLRVNLERWREFQQLGVYVYVYEGSVDFRTLGGEACAQVRILPGHSPRIARDYARGEVAGRGHRYGDASSGRPDRVIQEGDGGPGRRGVSGPSGPSRRTTAWQCTAPRFWNSATGPNEGAVRAAKTQGPERSRGRPWVHRRLIPARITGRACIAPCCAKSRSWRCAWAESEITSPFISSSPIRGTQRCHFLRKGRVWGQTVGGTYRPLRCVMWPIARLGWSC